MKLKTQLIALSALTLLLPWSGWKLVQELEQFLRDSQESAMLASARSIAGSLPVEYQSRLLFAPGNYLLVQPFERAPDLDGYADDWPQTDESLNYVSDDSGLEVSIRAGSRDGRLYLLLETNDHTPGYASTLSGSDMADGIQLLVRNPRGLVSFAIRPEAPGPLKLDADAVGGGQLEGYWLEFDGGYRVELALPSPGENSAVSFLVRNVEFGPGQVRTSEAGPLGRQTSPGWISLQSPWTSLTDWISSTTPVGSRTLLTDHNGWILADTGEQGPVELQQTTWLQRLMYRLVAGSRIRLEQDVTSRSPGFDKSLVESALAGEESVSWIQDLDTAVVINAVAVPLRLEGKIHGSVVVQSSSEGLLLVASRALGRLLFITLALTLGLAAGLWYFASRLSKRVRRLSEAVSDAMQENRTETGLPLTADHDELGELARNNDKLLRAVAEYTQYLQTLAGKLSHELNTPLAITRSSLENLSTQALDDDSRRYLDRALEGLERQSAIVRAMSAANRLEASIAVAEWESIDLVEFVDRCTEAYSATYADRKLIRQLPDGPVMADCAPDLLAQALDKLVENAMSLTGADDAVSVMLHESDSEVSIHVRNSGTSLPDEFRERLFDSLVSVREKRGEAPHLGLGLYIVKLVVAAHGGTVIGENLPNDEGVEFVIQLPVTSGSGD